MTADAPTDDRASLTGWLIWGVCATFFACAFFHRVAPSVMFDHLMRDYGVGAAVLGNLSACYFYAYCLVQLPVGALLDRVGPRLLLTGSALADDTLSEVPSPHSVSQTMDRLEQAVEEAGATVFARIVALSVVISGRSPPLL